MLGDEFCWEGALSRGVRREERRASAKVYIVPERWVVWACTGV